MEWLRIVGVDPGTDTLGWCLLEVNPMLATIRYVASQTLEAARATRHLKEQSEIVGGRFTRLQYLEDAMLNVFGQNTPDVVICESPFYNRRRPQAFESLVECKFTLAKALFRYSRWLPLESVSPASAKQSVGVVAKGSTKQDVSKALLKIFPNAPIANMDEHSVDAMAVAYYRALQEIRLYGWQGGVTCV